MELMGQTCAPFTDKWVTGMTHFQEMRAFRVGGSLFSDSAGDVITISLLVSYVFCNFSE